MSNYTVNDNVSRADRVRPKLINIDGFFNIFKPVGITSNACLAKFRRQANVKKSGYSGTLDPFAEGVLPIACGKATKLIEEVVSMDKEYVFVAQFGSETDTGDSEGVVVAKNDKMPTLEEINAKINEKFIGSIMQSPHVYSAIKINGTRLCDIARKQNIDPAELQAIADSRAKEIRIDKFEILPFMAEEQGLFNDMALKFVVKCGKGTYIRKLVVDLARDLGAYAHTIKLSRTAAGPFNIKDSIDLLTLNSDNLFDFCVTSLK